jgi:hypothetical protein
MPDDSSYITGVVCLVLVCAAAYLAICEVLF